MGADPKTAFQQHVYSKNGTYTILLTVTDNAGNKNVDSIQIKITAAGVVKNSGERNYNGINAYRAGKSIIVSGNSPNRNSWRTIESYNVKGQRTFSTILQPATSNAHVDLSASTAHGLPHLSIWRLKDGAQYDEKNTTVRRVIRMQSAIDKNEHLFNQIKQLQLRESY
ncbi:MAG: PKD domain-containing protein [Agrobacterium sp.]|nr:PKD domain-containing protein [Agrobacterium sp.]